MAFSAHGYLNQSEAGQLGVVRVLKGALSVFNVVLVDVDLVVPNVPEIPGCNTRWSQRRKRILWIWGSSGSGIPQKKKRRNRTIVDAVGRDLKLLLLLLAVLLRKLLLATL